MLKLVTKNIHDVACVLDIFLVKFLQIFAIFWYDSLSNWCMCLLCNLVRCWLLTCILVFTVCECGLSITCVASYVKNKVPNMAQNAS
jgi:hypothetical protein